MSQLKVNSIVPIGGVASGQGGGIIQVISSFKGDRFTTSSTSFVDITGMEVTITPQSTSSKILIMASFGAACTNKNDLDLGQVIRTLRNGSDDNQLNGVTDGNRIRITWKGAGLSFNGDHTPGGFGFSGVDSPATTNTLTYKLQVACQNSLNIFVLNGNPTNTDTNTGFNGRSMSSLIAMEISA